jgi:hypothetical protein
LPVVSAPKSMGSSMSRPSELVPSAEVDDHIIWTIPPKDMTAYNGHLPFGVGIVLNNADQDHLIIHHMGNATSNPHGQFHPMWYQKSDGSNYFRRLPLHVSHKKRTTINDFLSDTSTSAAEKSRIATFTHESCVSSKQIIYRASSVWNDKFLLATAARDALRRSTYVFEKWGRADAERDKALNKRLRPRSDSFPEEL